MPHSSSSTSLSFLSLCFLIFPFLCFSAKHSSSLNKIGQGYRLVSVEETSDGAFLGLLKVKQKNSIYGPDIPNLQLFVKHENQNRLRIHITDAEKQRWEVPYDLLPREKPATLRQTIGTSKKNDQFTGSEFSGSDLIFSYTTDPFGFAVKRRSDGQILFNSTSDESDPYSQMVFKDQYLEISTKLAKDASLYGLGESSRAHGIKLFPNDTPYTLWNTDVSAIYPNTDLYGSHPVYMDLRNSYAHGVLVLNSNGMDVIYRGDSLTYKIIGGVFDFYFFSGPSPLDVVDQYTSLIGRPAPMPYWSFGFHQCRWGYHNLSMVEDVVENYKKAQIPLDVIWNDDDHMDSHKDFTLNPTAYPRPKLLKFLKKIHSLGMKYIVLIDPGIGINNTYGVYNRAMANDIFIKYKGQPFVGQVWPGAVNFPDFLNPRTVSWWSDEIRRFHQLVPVDGLWIDMNEVSNFCNGLCTIPKNKICPSGYGPGWDCCLDCKNTTQTKWDDPPYKINASGTQALIGYKTIATSSVHYNGVLEYDAHNLYGFTESIATHKALQGLEGKRPFILSRSSFVGSGKYAAHWTGDNKGTWEDLRYSVTTMLNFGIFGMPMVGADICGFYPAPTEELCNRWIELGAFYPFSRDHANFYSPRQELYQWKSVAGSARNALGMRYKLLPYLYTLNYESHISGAPIARPLFFSFPNYTECYDVSTQFLLGSSVMVSPVLDEAKTNVTALFPPGTWYNLFDNTQSIVSKSMHYQTLPAPLQVINVHIYQNTILPMQQGGLISREARKTPFNLIVTFPAGARDGEASGKLYLDDDELPVMKLGTGLSTYVNLYASLKQGKLKIWSEVEEGEFAVEKGWIIEKVRVLGLDGSGGTAGLNINGKLVKDNSGVKLIMLEQNHLEKLEEGKKKSVTVDVHGLELPVGKNFTISWTMGN